MSEPVVVRSETVDVVNFPGGGKGRRVVAPQTGSARLLMGVIETEPGCSPHRWHTHTRDRGEGFDVTYPEGFEEAYYVVEGSGVVQWRVDGQVREREVREGDTVLFPAGVAESQLLNTGTNRMVIVYAATPIPYIRP